MAADETRPAGYQTVLIAGSSAKSGGRKPLLGRICATPTRCYQQPRSSGHATHRSDREPFDHILNHELNNISVPPTRETARCFCLRQNLIRHRRPENGECLALFFNLPYRNPVANWGPRDHSVIFTTRAEARDFLLNHRSATAPERQLPPARSSVPLPAYRVDCICPLLKLILKDMLPGEFQRPDGHGV